MYLKLINLHIQEIFNFIRCMLSDIKHACLLSRSHAAGAIVWANICQLVVGLRDQIFVFPQSRKAEQEEIIFQSRERKCK